MHHLNRRISFLLNQNSLKNLHGSLEGHIKLFHFGATYFAVEKSSLATLRKDTGFSLINCKKALELYRGDLNQAKEWLKKEAQQQGWEKATKLADRATAQGLIGFHISNGVGSLLELNCETDFVSKTSEFSSLVSEAVKQFSLSSYLVPSNEIVKQFVNKDTLGKIKTEEGKTLSDTIAMAVGKFGENIQLTRGVTITSLPNTHLIGYTHPSSAINPSKVGRYGIIALFKNLQGNEALARDLCAHIIGMNPTEIGSMDDILSEAEEEKVETHTAPKSNIALQENDVSSIREEEYIEETMPVMDEETVLVKQKFISDPDVTVGQVLKENEMEIIDFIKLQLGEKNTSDQII